MTNRRAMSLWLVILGVAAALRGWRLWWGLSDGLYFDDERIWARALGRSAPLSFALLRPQDLIYPTLYGYVSRTVLAAVHAAGCADILNAPRPALGMLRVARAVSAACSVVTVALVGVLGRRLYGRRTGVVAAMLMAVVPLAAMQVHYASVDSLLVTCVVLALLAAHALAERPVPRRALVAGAAVGLAFSAKYTGLAFAAATAWVVAVQGWQQRSPRVFLGLGAAAVVGCAAAILVGCPPCILRSDLLFRAVATHRALTSGPLTFGNAELTPALGWVGHRWIYQLAAGLPFSLGIALYALVVVGVVTALVRRTPADKLLLASIAPYFVVMGGSQVVFPRYLLPLAPALVILGARVIAARSWTPWRALALTVVTLYTGALAASQVGRFSYTQQREVARWLDAYLSADAGKGRVHLPAEWSRYWGISPFLRRRGIPFVQVKPRGWLDGEPAAIVIPEWFAIHLRRDAPGSMSAQDLARLEDGSAGYVEAARWPPTWYLQGALDKRLDPAAVGHLFQGEIGFRIYVRRAIPRSLGVEVPERAQSLYRVGRRDGWLGRVDNGYVAKPLEVSGELTNERRVIGGQVVRLADIVLEVEQLRGIAGVGDQFGGVADHGSHGPLYAIARPAPGSQ